MANTYDNAITPDLDATTSTVAIREAAAANDAAIADIQPSVVFNAAEKSGGTTYYVSAIRGLNIRSAATTSSDILSAYPNGQEVTVYKVVSGPGSSSGWGLISYNGGDAYVAMDYLVAANATNATTPTTSEGSPHVITGNGVNIRTSPSLEGGVIGSLYKGDVVNIIEEVNGWGKFYFNGVPSYVSMQYATPTGGTSASLVPTSSASPSPAVEDSGGYNITQYYVDYSVPPVDGGPVSSRTIYDSELLYKYELMGYSRAKMSVTTNVNGTLAMYHFEFLIGPSTMTENITNNITPIKTGGGYFIQRGGPGLSKLTLSGYFLDYKHVEERRNFLENYYRKYLVDKVNAFHEYFNESRLTIELMGYKYYCILTDLQLSRAADTLFTFSYNMGLLITGQEVLGIPEKPTNYMVSSPQSLNPGLITIDEVSQLINSGAGAYVISGGSGGSKVQEITSLDNLYVISAGSKVSNILNNN